MRITSLKEPNDDREFWRTKSPQERLEALELLRQQRMGPVYAEQRIQHVCRIIERPHRDLDDVENVPPPAE